MRCATCGVRPPAARDRCSTCLRYLNRTGRERPAALIERALRRERDILGLVGLIRGMTSA